MGSSQIKQNNKRRQHQPENKSEKVNIPMFCKIQQYNALSKNQLYGKIIFHTFIESQKESMLLIPVIGVTIVGLISPMM